ncbi:MAG: hypothetical protein AVDCRST_MAG11-1341, partial [uncultured Gemmatimonadaceae bacterium]
AAHDPPPPRRRARLARRRPARRAVRHSAPVGRRGSRPGTCPTP